MLSANIPRQKQVGITSLHKTQTRHHVTEDKGEKNWLHSDAQEKEFQLASGYTHIAMQQRQHCSHVLKPSRLNRRPPT